MNLKKSGLIKCLIANVVFFTSTFVLIKWEFYQLSKVEDAYIAPCTTVILALVIPVYLMIYGYCSYRFLQMALKPQLILMAFLWPFWICLFKGGWETLIPFPVIYSAISLMAILFTKYRAKTEQNTRDDSLS